MHEFVVGFNYCKLNVNFKEKLKIRACQIASTRQNDIN